jgi:HK97 gp10 family phage protein
MEFEFDFSEVTQGLEEMAKQLEKVETKATLKAAKIVKSAVAKNVGRSNITKAGYTHMADDVKVSGLKTDEDGEKYREVYGGKNTGYKWKFLEFGTSKMKGNQFMTKSLEETAEEVEQIINEEIKNTLDL